MEKLNKQQIDKILKERFFDIVNQIPSSYIEEIAESEQKADSIAKDMETSLSSINIVAKQFINKDVVLNDLKYVLLQVLNRETDQLVIMQEIDGVNRITPNEEVQKLNAYVISKFSEKETIELAKLLYNRVFSSIRTCAFFHCNKSDILFMGKNIMGKNVMPTTLTIFDGNKTSKIKK